MESVQIITNPNILREIPLETQQIDVSHQDQKNIAIL